jgi:hypothetical protein
MAARLDPQPPAPPAPESRETSEIRRRIVAGFYDRPDVALKTAARMLQENALIPEN